MIRIEHINIVVYNMEESLTFYQAAFPDWRIRDRGDGDWYGKPRQWLHFGDDFNYIAMNGPATGKPRDLTTLDVGLMHIGFEVKDLAALTERLQAAGYEIHSKGYPTEFRRNVYFVDPNGIEVEFTEYFSDQPSERNA